MAMVKVGDIVIITGKKKSGENGWVNSWNPKMDKAIGKVGRVVRIGAGGIFVTNIIDRKDSIPNFDRTFGFPPDVCVLYHGQKVMLFRNNSKE